MAPRRTFISFPVDRQTGSVEKGTTPILTEEEEDGKISFFNLDLLKENPTNGETELLRRAGVETITLYTKDGQSLYKVIRQ